MTIEEYVKDALSAKNISIKEAAEVLGYQEQSFRNKFTRHSISLRDLLIICTLLEGQLAVIDSLPCQVGQEFQPQFIFEAVDLLTEDDWKRITAFRNRKSYKIELPSWFAQNPHSREEGYSFVISPNCPQRIIICGTKHKEAAEWLTANNQDASPENERFNIMTCSKFYDVFISYE